MRGIRITGQQKILIENDSGAQRRAGALFRERTEQMPGNSAGPRSCPPGSPPLADSSPRKRKHRALRWTKSPLAAAVALFLLPSCWAAEGPFFVTYTHQMEEPHSLEFSTRNVTGKPGDGNRFLGSALEFEYGVMGWWTTEFYLDGQTTSGESTIFTGYRWENRFRLLPREHWINPVFYVEFENINGADKTLLEIVNHDSKADLAVPNSEARLEKQREIEVRLILGSYFKGWTIAENFIAEKNVSHALYEFGYAAGISRPLALVARPERCNFCPENFQLGVEMYGGLGTNGDFGFRGTSQYIAPTAAWTLANGTTFQLSPGFGITGSSVGFLLRFGVSYEIPQFGRTIRNLFRGAHS
jgi:hypothetical protein